MSDAGAGGLTPAFILHRSPYRETSLLLEALTPAGRLGLVARGARAGKGRLAPLLQPFTPLWLAWSGRGDLGNLTACELRPPPRPLAGRELFFAFYANELLLRLTRRLDPLPELFAAYERLLADLAEGLDEWALRRFEIALLAQLGYGLSLESDESGRPVQEEALYCYDLERGPIPAPAGAGRTLRGQTLLALADRQPPDLDSFSEARRLLRQVLEPHLGDKPLRSRELFRQLFTADPTQGDTKA